MMEYDQLEAAFHSALNVCDPIDFASRQKNLVYAIAQYLLDRDKPEEDEHE